MQEAYKSHNCSQRKLLKSEERKAKHEKVEEKEKDWGEEGKEEENPFKVAHVL